MIGEYNRQNPLYLLIMDSVPALTSNTLLYTRSLIINYIFEVIFLIVCVLSRGFTFNFILLLAVCILYSVGIYWRYHSIIIESPETFVYDTIYGDKYATAYLNNEELITLLQDMKRYTGVVSEWVLILRMQTRLLEVLILVLISSAILMKIF